MSASAHSSKSLLPGERIRVLIVDDSVVIRRLVSHALSESTVIEVVGAAADGSIALSKIPQVNPHVVTLDVEMPVMDGLQTLKQIRKKYPNIVVIMFSTLTSRGASITMEALIAGANDYVTKVANVGSLDESMGRLRQELIPKISQFFRLPGGNDKNPSVPKAAPRLAGLNRTGSAARSAGPRPRAVVVGVSTGGPAALASIMPAFPVNFPVPVLVVQHMPPVFTQQLANQLQTLTKLKVCEAKAGDRVEPSRVYIAPGNFHMRLLPSAPTPIISTDQGPPENSCRPAADVLFRSAAEVYQGACLGVILTGMGQDGSRGCSALKAVGARVIVQDEASSVVWGMPGAVVQAGLADAVLDLQAIVPEVLKSVM